MADIYQKYDDKSGEFADFGDLKARKDIGIVEDTDFAEHNIAAGQYVIWKGNLYTANSTITPTTALSTSNLTEVTIGGLNDIKNIIKSITTNISYNSLIKSSEIGRICRYGNIVQVTGNITFSDTFPIDWSDHLIVSNIPITENIQYCGIVRFDDTTVPSAIVVANGQGLCVNPRHCDIRGKQGILTATYIANN